MRVLEDLFKGVIEESQCVKIDEVSAELEYMGFARNFNESETEAKWSLFKLSKTGNITTMSMYEDKIFNQKWSDRVILFT